MPAPTFVGSANSSFSVTGSSATTAGVTVVSGDRLVVVAGTSNFSLATISSVTATGVTWTQQNSDGTGTRPAVSVWTGVATTTGSLTATATATSASAKPGCQLYAFRNTGGTIGGATTTLSSSNELNVEAAAAFSNSAFVFFGAAATGSGASRTPYTADAGAFTETAYQEVAASWTVGGGYYADHGSAGLKIYGYAPTFVSAQPVTAVGIEVFYGAPVTFFGSKMQQGVG